MSARHPEFLERKANKERSTQRRQGRRSLEHQLSLVYVSARPTKSLGYKCLQGLESSLKIWWDVCYCQPISVVAEVGFRQVLKCWNPVISALVEDMYFKETVIPKIYAGMKEEYTAWGVYSLENRSIQLVQKETMQVLPLMLRVQV